MQQFSVVLDGLSRKEIKDPLTFLSSGGFRVLSSLEEFNPELDKYIIVFEGIAYDAESVARLHLYHTLLDVCITVIGVDPIALSILDGFPVFHCSLADVSYETLRLASVGDESAVPIGSVQHTSNPSLDYANSVIAGVNFSSEEKMLAKSYLSCTRTLLRQKNELDQCNAKCEQLAQSGRALMAEYQSILKSYGDLFNRSEKLNKSLKDYEVILTKNFYAKVDIRKYNNKPQILYFKEYIDFLGLDLFLRSLFFAYSKQLGTSVKVLRLFDNTGHRKLSVLPEYYCKLYNEYRSADIVTNDYLAKTGDHAVLLDNLLTNKYGLQLLIIVDSKSYDDTVLGGNYLQFNLCRNSDEAGKLGLGVSNTILNFGSEGYMCWHRTEHDMIALAADETVRKVVSLLKVFSGTIV